MNCKHPIKSLGIFSKYKSSPDGYGGENSWEWYEFGCQKCKKEMVNVGYKNQRCEVTQAVYGRFTERVLDTKELAKVFQQNKTLYDWIKKENAAHDQILRKYGKRTDALEKKIHSTRKSIRRMEEKLRLMERDYNGD